MAYALKEHNRDAVVLSWRWNSPETFHMLSEWAERIILMQNWGREVVKGIPESCWSKVRIFDVGPDRWFNAFHPEIRALTQNKVGEWAQKNFEEV